MIRNFTIYLENGKSAEYELILGKPENRPSWPQQDTTLWQEINQINANPQFEENELGRMKWAGQLKDDERTYVSVEYELTVNTIRPELTIEDSGTIEDIPEGYEIKTIEEIITNNQMIYKIKQVPALPTFIRGGRTRVEKTLYC